MPGSLTIFQTLKPGGLESDYHSHLLGSRSYSLENLKMEEANPCIPEIPGMRKIQGSRIPSAEHKNHCWRCPNNLIWAVFPPITVAIR